MGAQNIWLKEHQRNHQNICSSLLEQYKHEGDNFLNCIITEDETEFIIMNQETKWQRMQRKNTSSPSKKFTLQPSAGKLVLTVFGDSQGPNLNTYGERYQGNKCKLLQQAKKWTKAGDLHKPGRKSVTRCCPVTRQCTHFYSTPHHQQYSKTKLGSSWKPCPQSRLGPFWFPSIWSPHEGCKKLSICRWWCR